MSEFDKKYDFLAVESKWQTFWRKERIYSFNSSSSNSIYSVDTPPAYVSADHLHVGHAMSYSQAEFIVRYHRMNGKRVYYPMGFDDNGLPTERYVEKKYNIMPGTINRNEFVRLCRKETELGIQIYRSLWEALGLSVDWNETYSTIDPKCQRTAQKSFIDLYQRKLIERRNDPIQWCCSCRTALSQADIEFSKKEGLLYNIAFIISDDKTLTISTTRPELLPACVALYVNPQDTRYIDVIGQKAIVPLFNHLVPIKTDDTVDPEFGTGIMMVCTFGDTEDVEKFRRDKLDLRIIIEKDGTLNSMAGEFAGLKISDARKRIIHKLSEKGLLNDKYQLEHQVGIHDRCGNAVEFIITPQWFISILPFKEEWLKRGDELRWFPEKMKVRFRDWVMGLKWDWNISRQRDYGVPFPIWYCRSCGAVILAKENDLPVDPRDYIATSLTCERCHSKDIYPENDVMDTWMTSSLTPFINANWAYPDKSRMQSLFPMSVRVQAFEIIRTWLFYTIVKGEFHTQSVPWHDVMISGWGLNEEGKKISKRELSGAVDSTGFNKYDPHHIIKKYGADSLRYWATKANLGNNLRYSEQDVKEGHRLLTKLWNASRYTSFQLKGFKPDQSIPFNERTIIDKWMWHHTTMSVKQSTESLEQYEFALARQASDRLFWHYYCDYYLEMIKDRFWLLDRFSKSERLSAQTTLYMVLRNILSLYAIYLPHITEEIYHNLYALDEGLSSIHISKWPSISDEGLAEQSEAEEIIKLISAIRIIRSNMGLPHSVRLQQLVIDCPPELSDILRSNINDVKSSARANEIEFRSVETITDNDGLRLILIPEST